MDTPHQDEDDSGLDCIYVSSMPRSFIRQQKAIPHGTYIESLIEDNWHISRHDDLLKIKKWNVSCVGGLLCALFPGVRHALGMAPTAKIFGSAKKRKPGWQILANKQCDDAKRPSRGVIMPPIALQDSLYTVMKIFNFISQRSRSVPLSRAFGPRAFGSCF